jgi:hypothetical protein
VVANLPAGRFTIAATKHGYVAGAYGATRAGRRGTPVTVVASQSFTATISLMPAAVVTGIIRDEQGQPLSGVRVFAIDARQPAAPSPGSRSQGAAGSGTDTDDRGVYRIFDLTPGDYILAATLTSGVAGDIVRRSAGDTDRMLAQLDARSRTAPSSAGARTVAIPPVVTDAVTFAPVYFPGTTELENAGRVTLGRGEVREGVDFAVRPVPVTSIEGAIVSPTGALPPYVQISIVSGSALEFFSLSSARPQLTRAPDASGQFKYSTIAPGHYRIIARAGVLAEPGVGAGGYTVAGVPAGVATSKETMYAVEEVDVTGQPVTGLTLRLQRGSTLTGRVIFDAASQPVPTDLRTIRVTVRALADTSAFTTRQYTQLRADGTFEFPGLAPGAYQILCTVPAVAGPGWWLRSATVGTRDTLDTSLDVVLGTDIPNLVLTLTDRHSELSGSLQTPSGSPAPEYFVVVMPAEPALRIPGSRRIASTRPGTDGQFKFVDLPAGSYLLVALNDLPSGELQRRDFLSEIAAGGVPITLAQGEKKVQALKIGR